MALERGGAREFAFTETRERIKRQVEDEQRVKKEEERVKRLNSVLESIETIDTQLSVIRTIILGSSILLSDEEKNSLTSIYGKLSMRRDFRLEEIAESEKC
jgi:hypothetical protein